MDSIGLYIVPSLIWMIVANYVIGVGYRSHFESAVKHFGDWRMYLIVGLAYGVGFSILALAIVQYPAPFNLMLSGFTGYQIYRCVKRWSQNMPHLIGRHTWPIEYVGLFLGVAFGAVIEWVLQRVVNSL